MVPELPANYGLFTEDYDEMLEDGVAREWGNTLGTHVFILKAVEWDLRDLRDYIIGTADSAVMSVLDDLRHIQYNCQMYGKLYGLGCDLFQK